MYFKYIWNNFLHIQVEICTAMILAMPPAPSDTQQDTEQEHARESILIKHVGGEADLGKSPQHFVFSLL